MSLSGLTESYHNFFTEHEDPRTTNWMLMQSPMLLLAILAFYLLFCVKWGPKLMENRKPFELKNTMLVYNAANVLASVWMVYEALASGWWNDYSFRCQLVDYTDNPKALRMARLAHVYYICKLLELADTVFFVTRKKDNQVTFLHLYHHSTMPFWAYLTVKFVPGGQMMMPLMLNSFVHFVMYSYYLIAALGPKYQKILRLKPYVTMLQLGQFVVVILHLLQVFGPDCSYPKAMPTIMIVNVLLFFCLFWSFYKRSYRKPAEKTLTNGRRHDLNKERVAKID